MARILLLLVVTTMLGMPSFCFAQTPHSLLRNSTPEDGKKALEMMKKDLSWINRNDSESQETPLHVAARFNHEVVVKWLLDNGADVNAQAYNRFTPLHLTTNPEIVKLILEKKPNLQLESVSGTPLQSAIKDLRHWNKVSKRSPEAKRKSDDLRKIVEMFVEHLGDDIDLMSAIRLGQLDTAKRIVNLDPSAAHGRKRGASPLREAANWGELEMCKFLVEVHKVDIDDFHGGWGFPIIKGALDHPAVVKYLVEQGADLETRITWKGGRSGVWIVGDDATALHYAACDGGPETIKLLMDEGVDPFATAHDISEKVGNQTALEVAAFFGKTDNAIAILEHPKFKEAQAASRKEVLDRSLSLGSYSSWLAFAAQDRSELLDALIANGADVNKIVDGYSAMQVAVRSIHPSNEDEEEEAKNKAIRKMISVLRKHGAKLDVFSAVAIGDFDSLAQLLAESPEASSSCSLDGVPALHKAIAMNYPKAVKLLLDAGCDLEIMNKSKNGGEGETPIFSALFWNRIEIAETLIKAGANVNAKNGRAATPLHEAIRRNDVNSARLLLENGADLEAKDGAGRTPQQLASSSASFEKFLRLLSECPDAKKLK